MKNSAVNLANGLRIYSSGFLLRSLITRKSCTRIMCHCLILSGKRGFCNFKIEICINTTKGWTFIWCIQWLLTCFRLSFFGNKQKTGWAKWKKWERNKEGEGSWPPGPSLFLLSGPHQFCWFPPTESLHRLNGHSIITCETFE